MRCGESFNIWEVYVPATVKPLWFKLGTGPERRHYPEFPETRLPVKLHAEVQAVKAMS
jgi:hypothetical protein